MKTHAEQAYPNECCGLMLRSRSDQTAPLRLRKCTNAQDSYHRLDPVSFPRTARNAYFIDPKELLEIERERRSNDETIVAIYHSHCDAEAYFSEEDANRAKADGEPLFPMAAYVVISVRSGRATGLKVFRWRRDLGRFLSDCGEIDRA